jgi:hypothetical protein
MRLRIRHLPKVDLPGWIFRYIFTLLDCVVIAMANARRLKNGKSAGRPGKRSGRRGNIGIQQGVGSSVRRPFGSTRIPRSLAGAFDATCSQHLALPTATGPYTTVRVTQLIKTNERAIFFGTFRGGYDRLVTSVDPPITNRRSGWAPYCAVSGLNDNGSDNPATSAIFYKLSGIENLGPMATVVPSALSVQIMNPNALQSTNGILYIGRMSTQVRGEDETSTWDELANEFVSYQAPRLCSAGKLALRGVKVDAAPFNLQELQDFDRIVDPADSSAGTIVAPWKSEGAPASGADLNSRWNMKGFSPIAVYNPENVAMNYLVTMELRVRFDMGHPAASTHQHHTASTTPTWSHALKQMADAGHGAMDIAENVAQLGQRAYQAISRYESRGGNPRPMPMLVD